MAERPIPTSLDEWLDDLTVRFLLNLPASELSSVPRLCFQVEEAQWFYEDFVRPAVAATGAAPLPSLALKPFCLRLFQHCPLLSGFSGEDHIAAYEEFLAYKVRVPVRGAILLNQNMDKLLLVRGWKKGASWSFPRGKINKDEKDLDCAIREVWEETGYDLAQSGLIPEDENEVKHLDVTMREQHMRLFAFRGVPEDTYFEPKTRKEIGKIQWYSLKDLPGFKKNKQGYGDGTGGNASKFYMVAPFMGQLKRWIADQKRKDSTRARDVSAKHSLAEQTATEDEGVLEEYTTDTAAVDEKAEELKRMLSIGGPTHPQQDVPQQAGPEHQASNLLAMLQNSSKPLNGGQLPRTPFEQVNNFFQQPDTPQAQHIRQPSMHQFQNQAPQFPFSPPRMQHEQQRNITVPKPNVFGQPTFGPNHAPSFNPGFAHMPPPHQQHHQFQQRFASTGHPNGMMFRQPHGMGMPMHQPQTPPNNMQPPFQHQQPPNAFVPQGPQGAIGSGPTAPNASQLPAPKLNPHSMKLLDAFKSGNKPSSSAHSNAARQQAGPRPASGQGSALLGLLNLPSNSSSKSPSLQPPPPQQTGEPPSPTLTDATVRPAKLKERKPTLNEITRAVVSVKPKVKSPPVSQDPTPTDAFLPRHDWTPSSVSKPSQAISRPQQSQPNGQAAPVPVAILQPPPRSSAPRSPKPTSSRPLSRKFESPSRNGNQSPSYTILARPGSSKGPQSPVSAVPVSPLRSNGPSKSGPAFHPQILQRPKSGAGTSDADQPPTSSASQTDHLLSLFNKTPNKTAAPPASIPTPDRKPSQTEEPKAALLSLLTANKPTSQQPTPSPLPSQEPPPAPKITPENRPTKAFNPHNAYLLNLLNETSAGGKTELPGSPGTPISPFTLGTPANAQLPNVPPPLGTAQSPVSPSVATPTEHREFLQGFLNDVVKGEGFRGLGQRKI